VAFHFSKSADKTVYALSIPDRSNIVHNADKVKFVYHDSAVGKDWDQSGRYANLKYFVLTREMYAKGQMLILDGNSSGKWTPKQQQLIQWLGLAKN
jgi:hypothetical protein